MYFFLCDFIILVHNSSAAIFLRYAREIKELNTGRRPGNRANSNGLSTLILAGWLEHMPNMYHVWRS